MAKLGFVVRKSNGQDTLAKTAPAVSKQSEALTPETVAKRAYVIWASKGRPVGQDVQNWREAEASLRAEQTKV